MRRISAKSFITAAPLLFFVFLLAFSVIGCSQRNKNKAEESHAQGMELYKDRQYSTAVNKFEEALKLQPNRVDTLIQCAKACLKVSKPDEALSHAQKALVLDPANASASLLIGRAHLARAGRRGDPVESATRGPLNQKELDEAAAVAAQLLRQNPDAADPLLLQAQIEHVSLRLDSAEIFYRKVLALEPANRTALQGLTELLIARKAYREAEMIARKTVEAGRSIESSAIRRLAQALAFQKKYDEAYQAMAPSISNQRQQPNAKQFLLTGRILLAHVSELTGLKEAVQSPLAGLASMAIFGSAAGKLIVDPAKGGTPELAQAARRLTELGTMMKRYYPSLPESFFFQAVSSQIQGRTSEAISNLEEARAKAPSDQRYRMALALAHMQAGHFVAARQELRVLLRLNPNDFDARLHMAQCHAAEGSCDEAMALMRELLNERPEDRAVMQNLGKLLAMTAKPENLAEGITLLAQAYASPATAELAKARELIKEAEEKMASASYEAAHTKYQKARELLQGAAEHQPNSMTLQLKLAELAIRQNDLFTAMRHVDNAVRIDPQLTPLKARIFTRLGQLAAARQIYEPIITASPQAIGYQLAIADLDYQMNKTAEAQKRYDSLVKRYPDDPRPYLRRALLIGRQRDIDEAISFLTKRMNKFPEEMNLRLALAQLLMKTKRHREAVRVLTKAVEKREAELAALSGRNAPGPAVQDAREALSLACGQLALAELLSGRTSAAVKHASKVIEVDPGEAMQASMIKTLALLQSNLAAQAVATLEAIKVAPDKVPPALPLVSSLAHLAAGKPSDVQAELENQPNLNTNTLVLYHRMLERYSRTRLRNAAPDLALLIFLNVYPDCASTCLTLADMSLRSMRRDPFILSRKAETYQMMGKLQEALKVYAIIENVVPEFSPVLLAEADLHLALAEQAQTRGENKKCQEERQAAANLCRTYLKKHARDPQAIQKLATIVQLAGQLDEANQLYRQAIEIDRNSWSAYNNLAWNLAEKNELDEAARMGERALKAAADVGGVQDTLGWIELKRGKFNRAVELLTKASLRLPNDPDVRFHLAQALHKNGKSPVAVAELEAITLATPNYQRIQEVRELLRQLDPQSQLLIHSNDKSSSTSQAAGN